MLEHINDSPEKPTRVVVIGAGGFVGSAITKQLVAADVSVLSLTRKELDLLAAGAAAKLRGLLMPNDSLVLVSAIAPAKTVSMLMQNLKMVEAVCEALAEKEIAHLVYISSDAVYADEANPVTETSPVAPTTIHGMMHAARELMLKSSTQAPLAFLRPTLIYGAADPHNGYGPNRFRRQAEKNESIQIFGEGEEKRDHVLIDDVARVAVLVLCHRSSGALNVVTGVSTSFSDIAGLIAQQYGTHVVSQPRLGPRAHLVHRFFDIACMIKAFPTFHYTSVAKGLDRTKQGVV